MTGTPVSRATCGSRARPRSPTRSKCAVSPRITAPRQITASIAPGHREPALATSGISNAPGDPGDSTSSSRDAVLRERRQRPLHQLAGDGLVESRRHDGDPLRPRRPAARRRCIARGSRLGLRRRRPGTSSRWPIFSRFVRGSRCSRRGLGPERDPLDDRQAVALEAGALGGVVRQQTHRAHAEVDEDLRADAVVALVGREARARCSPRRCRGPGPAARRPGACA